MRIRRALTLALGGFLAALLSTWGAYTAARYHSQLLPGTLFGASMSVCLALFGSLRSAWRAIILIVASTFAYYVSVEAAFAAELYAPFPQPHRAGAVSEGTLFVGGFAGMFLLLCMVSLLVDPKGRWTRRFVNAVFWSPVGGVLAVLGWELGSSLGISLWLVARSMGLTSPTETIQNALNGETSHQDSLWVVWQTGVGFLLGFKVSGDRGNESGK
jgi:hypothetical protein